MRFFLSGSLGSGAAIFGDHTISRKLFARIGMSKDFAPNKDPQQSKGFLLIYVSLSPENSGSPKGFDAGALLNSAFGLNLPQLAIPVNAAGFFQLQSSDAYYQEVIAQFPEIPFPTNTGQNSVLNSLTCFWAEIDFSAWSISNSIIEIGNSGAAGSALKLYAYYYSADNVKTSVYTAEIPDFSLLGSFGFSGIQLQYTLSDIVEYKLQGQLQVSAFNQQLSFTGLVSKTGNILTAIIAGSANSIKQPFDGQMPGIEFAGLQFGMISQIKTDSPGKGIARLSLLQGTVSYGGLSLTGAIYLDGAAPVLAVVIINQSLDIAALFGASVQGAWPNTFIDIRFNPGSSIYYCKQGYDRQKLASTNLSIIKDGSFAPLPVNAIDYDYGFTVSADVDLTIKETISLTGNINIKQNGVKASIQLNHSIDLYVLTLKQPVLSFDSTVANSYVQLLSGIEFFGDDVGDVAVTLERSGANQNILIKAVLSIGAGYEIFLGQAVTLTVSYSKDQGFQISGWPLFTIASDIIDFIQQIKDAVNKSAPSCGDTVSMDADGNLKTSFSIQPGFYSTNQDIFLSLSGTVTLSCKNSLGFNYEGTINIPDGIQFAVTGKTLSDLPGMLLDNMASVPGKFFDVLCDNTHVFASVIAILFADQAMDMAGKLQCLGKIPGFVSVVSGVIIGIYGGGHGSNGNGGQIGQATVTSLTYSKNQLTATWEQLDNATYYQFQLLLPDGSIKGPVNFSALNGSIAIDPVTIPEGTITGMVRGMNDNLTAQWGANHIIKPGMTTGIQLVYDATKEVLKISWALAEGYSLYDATLLKDGTDYKSFPSIENNLEVDISTLVGGVYTVQVRITGTNNNLPGNYGTGDNSIPRLHTPKINTALFDNDVVTVTWEQVDQATAYILTVDSAGVIATANTTSLQASVQVSNFADGTCKVYVVAKGKQGVIDSQQSQEADVLDINGLALYCHQQNYTPLAAATTVHDAFPQTQALPFAVAFAKAGYKPAETTQALKQEFATLNATQVTDALLAAYGTTDPAGFAQYCFAEGMTALEAAEALVTNFPGISFMDFTVALAKGGYKEQPTILALKEFFPSLTAQQVTDALMAAYGT